MQQPPDGEELETVLPEMYRCTIEPTGQTLRRVATIRIPMGSRDDITYSEEPEWSIRMSQTELTQFLHDFEEWAHLIYVCQKHPELETEFQKLIILAHLYE